MNMPRIIKKLTNQDIVNAKPQKKPYRLNDGERLHIIVRPNNRKVWQISYSFVGKRNTYTIGDFNPSLKAGHISLKEARGKRDEIVALVKQGINPNTSKNKEMIANDSVKFFEEVAREWHQKGVWVERYKKRILSSLENDAFPFIGNKPVDEVTRSDITAIASKIEERGKLEAAKRVIKRCEAILDFAVHLGICEHNVAMGVTRFMKPHVKKHRPFLKEQDLPDFLKKLDEYHGRDYIRLALKLQVLTFVRPGELRKASWDEIDFQKCIWRIPAKRMKMRREHIVPLSKQSMKILEDLRHITGNHEFIFPGIHKIHKPMSDTALLKVLKIMGYVGDKKVTVHGFRHTASTILNEKGFNGDAIEMQLAHAPKNAIRGTYNHAQYLDERTQMMQWYADHLDRLKNSA